MRQRLSAGMQHRVGAAGAPMEGGAAEVGGVSRQLKDAPIFHTLHGRHGTSSAWQGGGRGAVEGGVVGAAAAAVEPRRGAFTSSSCDHLSVELLFG